MASGLPRLANDGRYKVMESKDLVALGSSL